MLLYRWDPMVYNVNHGMTVVVLQLVTSATCFGLILPSSGLQRLVSIKVYNVAVLMTSHDLQCKPWDPISTATLIFVSLMMAKQGRNMLLM